MARESQGWFRRKKGRLVFCWNVKSDKTGKIRERSQVVGLSTLPDSKGREIVGVLKKEGKIRMDCSASPDRLSFAALASYYFANKAFKKQSTKALHEQIVNGICISRWRDDVAIEIKPVKVKRWLESIEVEDPTREKYRSVMGTVYTFAQCEGIIPLGLEHNPLHWVKGFSSVSDYEAMTLEPEQTYRVLELLEQAEYTLLLLIAATGLRMSEALGLRWIDILWEKGQIKIRQTFVHNLMQDGAKTRLSKSSVEMHSLLAAVLRLWQQETLYSKPEDYVFASYKLGGKKPRVGSMIVEDYLRPAAMKAGIIKVDADGQAFDTDGNEIRRFGFHTFRHSLASFLMAEGENPAVIQATLRHTRLDMTMYYSHARKQQKRDAQGMVLEAILAKREPKRGLEAMQP
jgi:integrase